MPLRAESTAGRLVEFSRKFRVWRIRRWFWRHVEIAKARKLGAAELDTEDIIELHELGYEAPGRTRYQPSRFVSLERGLRGSRIERDDVFLDYGCGKGRVVVQAALGYGFGRVIGVELIPELAGIASDNVARVRSRMRAGEVRIITADARTWDMPDDVTHVYMYRPFHDQLFRDVVQQVVASLDRAPRRLRLIYVFPDQESDLLATGRFRRVASHQSPERTDNHRVSVYESLDIG